MATGVPRKRHQGTISSKRNGVRLVYAEKRDEAEILTGPKPEVVEVWKNPLAAQQPLANRLYYGDNLAILRMLLSDKDVCGKVRLVYIDPPFSTQSVFHSRKLTHAYEDTLAGADFIEFLRVRLVLLQRLLAHDGSIYLHLDGKMIFVMKIIMDEIFGEANYKNLITRKKCNPKNYTRKQYGNVTDYILFYTKSAKYVWNKPLEPWTEERAKEYQYVEQQTGRRFMKVPIHAPGVRHGETGKPWRGILPPPGKHWQFPPSALEKMDARGEMYWSANGNPRRKVYLDENPGIGVQDIWMDFRDAHNQNIKITGYPTEKNSDLLTRIIEASSHPGDVVLDCFSGSGTTLAVAEGLGRQWIGVDNSIEAITTTLRRFAKGTEPMGDFTGPRNGTSQPPNGVTNETPDLFASVQKAAETVPLRSESTHRPITNFRLFVERTDPPLPTDRLREHLSL